MNQLKKLLEQSILVLDDNIPFMSLHNTDQFSLNALITGCHTAVIDTLKGMGKNVLSDLRRFSVYPKNVFVTKIENDKLSLTKKILHNREDILFLKKIVENCRLKYLLCFLPTVEIELLSEKIGVSLINGVKPSDVANSKIFLLKLSKQLGFNTPHTLICKNENSLRRYIHKRSIIKYPSSCGGYGNFPANRMDDVIKHNTYPVLLQQKHNCICSVTDSYFIDFQGNIERLESYTQIIRNISHVGSSIPDRFKTYPKFRKQMISISMRICRYLFDHMMIKGVIGIDYILTDTHELMVIDLNARFCTTTFPLIFLYSLGIPFECMRLATIKSDKFHNLDEVKAKLKNRFFNGRTGIFPYYPEYNFTEKRIKSFKLLIKADSEKELSSLMHYSGAL